MLTPHAPATRRSGGWGSSPERGRQGFSMGAPAMMLAVALLVCMVSPSGAAQELLYGSLRWEQVGPTTVKFFVDMAWSPMEDYASDVLLCTKCAVAPSTLEPHPQPAFGDIVYIKKPSEENRTAWGQNKNRFLFGDEVFNISIGNTGSGIAGIQVKGAIETNLVKGGIKTSLISTYAEFTHSYSALGVYEAALEGCCRLHSELKSHQGVGWHVGTRVVVNAMIGNRTNNNTMASLYIPLQPEIVMKRNVLGDMYVKAFDIYGRGLGGSSCNAQTQAGCRATYRFATTNESGWDYAASKASYTENPAGITIDKSTGLITFPQAISTGTVLTDPGLMYNLVVLAFSGDYAGPNAAAIPYVTVDFNVVFNDNPGIVPKLLPVALNGSEPANWTTRNAWSAAVPDQSTGAYFDHVCEYESIYDFTYNVNNPTILSIHLQNISAQVPDAFLRTIAIAPITRPFTNYWGDITYRIRWKPPCDAVGAFPVCWRVCEGGPPGQGLCSPPACARFEVQDGCLQGLAAFSAATAPSGTQFKAVVGVQSIVNFSTSAVADTSFKWINMSSVPGGFIDSSDSRIAMPNDRKISVKTDPGLPNGMVITSNLYASNATQDAVRTATWTPLPGEEGLVYSSCLEVKSASKPGTCRSESRCFTFAVEKGAPLVQQGFIAVSPPRFQLNATVIDGAELSTAPGCLVQIKYTIVRGPYQATLQPEGTVGVPPGTEIRRLSTGAPAPGGKFLDEWEVSWRPTRDFLQREYPACLEVMDDLNRTSGGPEVATDVRCVTFKMMRCRYCATEGQSLLQIASYWWGADWIQLWGANSYIRNPSRMAPNELLTLGPTYIVKRGDTLNRLADRFGLSLARLELLNPHTRNATLAPGTDLCIMPEVCPGNEDTLAAPARVSYTADSPRVA